MSNLKELTGVLDDYLKDYAHPVDWPKFREALREINKILKSILYPGKCPNCSVAISIDKLMENVEYLELLQQENYYLGLKHGMEAKLQPEYRPIRDIADRYTITVEEIEGWVNASTTPFRVNDVCEGLRLKGIEVSKR